MVQQKQEVAQKTVVSGNGKLVEQLSEKHNEEEKNIPIEYMKEFISLHHLNRLWDEFIYEKNHPKIELSASDVLALINLPPDEQDKILNKRE